MYVPSDFTNIIDFGFKQHLTYVIHVVQQKKKHLPAGSLGKNIPGESGNEQFF
jgi:hypothetical protein